ncbi:hypothetical protein [Saccharothrix sp. HUAS TT1]|uniref:hypothetical protein n=1 Tax=unclassified Saccharothrix TaxID=2593673 RepID=UPI00345BDA38
MTTPLPPGRVSLADVQHALLAEFHRTGDPYWVSITPTRLRVIKHRHLSRGPGYDLVELTSHLDRLRQGDLTMA